MDPRFVELEQDPPNWRELASAEDLSGLSKKETKRQEVINGEERELKQLLYENHDKWNKISLMCYTMSTPSLLS